MRTENDLRSALRALERETPDTGTVLSQVAERTSARTAARERRPGRRLLAGSAAAAAVIAIAVAAALLVGPLRGHGQAAQPNASQSVPRYYMAIVSFNPQLYARSGDFSDGYAAVKDRITGRTVATVQPPRPYVGFLGVTGAADDRTFVLTATRITTGSETVPYTFFYARFNPADDAITLTPLALPGLPVMDDFLAAALSPDGTKLGVESVNPEFPTSPAQIKVYSLPSGAAKTWSAGTDWGFAAPIDDQLSWSRAGSLDFSWPGSTPGSTAGTYLLNTNGAGGSLLADSREVFCPVLPRWPQWPRLSISEIRPGWNLGINIAFLTPDGATLISGVPQPIPVGQRPPACRSRGLRPTMPVFEEFSVSTGQATSVLYPSYSHHAVSDVYWSNPSGSVLVVYATTRSKIPERGVFGILTGSTFTPIPGSSTPPPPVQLLAF
jgi:hypothetical protein